MVKYVNLDDCEVVYCGSDGDYEKYNIPYDMPTPDVVEVVRCKDCKYREGSACDYSAVYVRPEGYCQWGEKEDAK